MSESFDLFGHPISSWSRGRGRPPYEPTDKDRNKIKLLLALGWSIERMANGIGVSAATLKRYFRAELKERGAMRDRLDARRFEIAMEQANAGNVAALKELGKMLDSNDRMKASNTEGDWAGPHSYGQGAEGEPGPPGPAANVVFEEPETGLPGTNVDMDVTGSGTTGDPYHVTFTIPRGDPGHDGTGTGDVTGPTGASAGRIALFDGTTGKLLMEGPLPFSGAYAIKRRFDLAKAVRELKAEFEA